MQSRSLYSKLRSPVKKIFLITLFWTLLSVFQFLFGYSRLEQFDCVPDNISSLLFGIILAGIIVGLIGGSFIVFYWENWLRTKSYGRSLFNIFLSYTFIYFFVSVITGMFYQSAQLNLSLFHKEVWQQIWLDISGINNAQNFLFWLSVFIITLITLMVNDKFGPGVFVSFLRGRYFHPKREDRIFMFLDLRGATTIAEQLGEEQYFNFLRDVYKDATPGILNSKGEIYQYVGDEIVVSWNRDSGTKDANCLQCFFDIQQSFLNRASYYQENYNEIIPDFKAGLHYGFVMVGEIGIVKRDIAYSGDVLNTTSRIEGKCNELNVNILLSNNLLEVLGSLPNTFKSKKIGEISLRGKQSEVILYTV